MDTRSCLLSSTATHINDESRISHRSTTLLGCVHTRNVNTLNMVQQQPNVGLRSIRHSCECSWQSGTSERYVQTSWTHRPCPKPLALNHKGHTAVVLCDLASNKHIWRSASGWMRFGAAEAITKLPSALCPSTYCTWSSSPGYPFQGISCVVICPVGLPVWRSRPLDFQPALTCPMPSVRRSSSPANPSQGIRCVAICPIPACLALETTWTFVQRSNLLPHAQYLKRLHSRHLHQA